MIRYKVKLADLAKEALREIHDYISEQSCALVATKVLREIVSEAKMLAFSPHLPVVDKFGLAKLGYRKRSVGNYTIFFRINETEKLVTIEIITHGARNWPKLLRNIEKKNG